MLLGLRPPSLGRAQVDVLSTGRQSLQRRAICFSKQLGSAASTDESRLRLFRSLEKFMVSRQSEDPPIPSLLGTKVEFSKLSELPKKKHDMKKKIPPLVPVNETAHLTELAPRRRRGGKSEWQHITRTSNLPTSRAVANGDRIADLGASGGTHATNSEDIVDSGSPSSEQWTEPRSFQLPISYTRRVDGLLGSLQQPVLQDLKSPSEHRDIARLAHGLDRVLFNPGVYWLQDPRSQVYNFTTYLESVPNVKEFAFERLAGFISSSRDEDLHTLAKQECRKFAGSTSSLTGILSHVYFLISEDKRVDTSTLSRYFQRESDHFTLGQRMPTDIVLKYKDGVYAIDKDSLFPGEAKKNVLTWLGTLLEKFFTTSPEAFSALLRSMPMPPPEGEKKQRPMREAFRYAKSAKLVMRSQLDCQDPRLPGTGVFDIKTRAAVATRLDIMNYEENAGYLIKSLYGPLESFEKEYYDLIRSAFLKYSFQARIGNMDGVFVAYHNTARIFGFQYIPLEEMDQRLYGSSGKTGELVFEKCIGLLENVLEEIALCFPEQSVKCVFETLEGKHRMHVWVWPVEWDEASQGPPPLFQLDVMARNFLNEERVRGFTAISPALERAPWTVHWSIRRSSLPRVEIEKQLEGAKGRIFRAYNFPTGHNEDTISDFWHTKLQFGTREAETAEAENGVPLDPGRFRPPSRDIKKLRRLARVGRAELEKRKEVNAGRRPVVWGDPDAYVDYGAARTPGLSGGGEEHIGVGELEGEDMVDGTSPEEARPVLWGDPDAYVDYGAARTPGLSEGGEEHIGVGELEGEDMVDGTSPEEAEVEAEVDLSEVEDEVWRGLTVKKVVEGPSDVEQMEVQLDNDDEFADVIEGDEPLPETRDEDDPSAEMSTVSEDDLQAAVHPDLGRGEVVLGDLDRDDDEFESQTAPEDVETLPESRTPSSQLGESPKTIVEERKPEVKSSDEEVTGHGAKDVAPAEHHSGVIKKGTRRSRKKDQE